MAWRTCRTVTRRSLLWIAAALAVGSGCRSARPLVGGEARSAAGTISGVVAGPDGIGPVRGRLVEAVEVRTGDRYSATTSATGSYSIEVPPGRYQLEVELAEGEKLIEEPGVISVDPGELVTGESFVLAGAGVVGS